jgi:acetyl-CoA C-acetyltransferase
VTVYVLGGSQTDFSTKWARAAEHPLLALLGAASYGALEDADVSPSEVQTAHVANFIAESAVHQSHLGAMLPMLDPAWSALPTSRHEAACASGSVAVLAAAAELEAGRYDVALVVGVELMRDLGDVDASQLLGAAAWTAGEPFDKALPWPDLFDRIGAKVKQRYGLDRGHLTRIAELNRNNAKNNPLAQSRSWELTPEMIAADHAANPVVIGDTRRIECGLITDGAAAVILASDQFVEGWSRRRRTSGGRASVLRGWGHHSAPLSLSAKFALSEDQPYLFPNVRATITDAYRRAEVSVQDLDVIETHDCFAINEYVALEHLGITGPGEAWKAVEDGRIEMDGAIPVNPSGGLLGAGHPVGATGVRMLLDVHKQVTGSAGGYQVDGAQLAATLNIGGSCSTAVSLVVGRAEY